MLFPVKQFDPQNPENNVNQNAEFLSTRLTQFTCNTTNSNYNSLGLLLLRIIGGLMMVYNHGWRKITADPEKWNRLGHALTDFIGLEFLSTFFGFMAAFSESVCALLIIIGLFTRPASILLFFIEEIS